MATSTPAWQKLALFGTPRAIDSAVDSILRGRQFPGALQLIGVYAWTRMATSIQTVLSFWQIAAQVFECAARLPRSGRRVGARVIVVAPTLLSRGR